MGKTKRPSLCSWRTSPSWLVILSFSISWDSLPAPPPLPLHTLPVRLSSLLRCALSDLIVLLKPPFAWHSHITLGSVRWRATSACPSHKVQDGPVRSVSFQTSLCTSERPTSSRCRVEAVVVFAEWLHAVWPPHHLTTRHRVSTCVAYIESCDATAFFCPWLCPVCLNHSDL